MKNKKNKEDIDFEIRFYEGVLKNEPDFVEAISAVAELYTKKGLYEKGLAMDEKLSGLRPDDPTVLYNLACSYSLVNNVDASLKAIKESIKCGYDDFRHLEQDDDLTNLRADRRFQEILMAAKDRKKIHENKKVQ